MKESLWGYYLILLGIMVTTIMIMISNMTTSNQQNYYLLKEVTNAAMIDAIDFGYYRTYGEIKINTEKFLENFLRRFAQSVSKNYSYKIDFYSIYENPPSVSIKVTTNTGNYQIAGDSTNFDVINTIDAVLEANNSVNFDYDFYSIPYASCTGDDIKDDNGYCKISTQAIFNSTQYYKEVVEKFKKQIGANFTESNIKILSSKYLKPIENNEEINKYTEQFNYTYDYSFNGTEVPSNVFNEDNLADIKDVKFAVVEDENNNKILSWAAKFKCDNPINEDENIKKYRKILPTNSNYNEFYGNINNYSNDFLDGYEYTPYYNSCLVGIKYKIVFYYDNK